jgi:hypothetical protein
MNDVRIRKMIAVITCICFVFLCSGTAFANEPMEIDDISNISSYSILQGDDYVIEQYTYEENGKQLECTLRIMENEIVGVVYELRDMDKYLYDQFTISRIDNGIYMNDIQIADISDITLDNTVMPMEVYAPTYSHGEVDFTAQITAASMAASIYLAIAATNPWIGVASAVFLPAATWYLSNQMNTGYYQIRMQLETFPENVPPEYTGAITKVDYLYTLYKSAEMVSSNRAADPVSDVYYGMPY